MMVDTRSHMLACARVSRVDCLRNLSRLTRPW